MNYNVLKKHPERPHQSLKCTSRVKRWSPVDLANLTPNSLLTRKKHWDEEFNVSLCLSCAGQGDVCYVDCSESLFFTRKSLFFVIFQYGRNLIPSSRPSTNTRGKLQACRGQARSRERKDFRMDLDTSGLGGDFEVPLPERLARHRSRDMRQWDWSTFALIQHYSPAGLPVPSHPSVPRHRVLLYTEPQQTRGDWALLCPWLFWD